MDYIQQAQILHDEADKMLLNTQLINRLFEFGTVHMVGSYAYNLMVWKDLDLLLEMPDDDLKLADDVLSSIRSIEHATIRILDNRNKNKKDRPKGVWIGLYIHKWKIDIWIMNQYETANELSLRDRWIEKYKAIDRQSFLSLKTALAKDPGYHKAFSSVDIYEAFSQAQVRGAREFYAWFNKKRQRSPI